jgi:transcriptional regulator with XRE-family HTH domain
MTQKQLGDALGMAQTWVSKLESPDYGKMSVATLLRLAEAFDTDLEIKFRPFSVALDVLPSQGPEYFVVPSFEEEKIVIEAKLAREDTAVNAWTSAASPTANANAGGPLARNSLATVVNAWTSALPPTANANVGGPLAGNILATAQEMGRFSGNNSVPMAASDQSYVSRRDAA